MCGRYVLASDPEELAASFGARVARDLPEGLAPSFNVAPTATVLGLRLARDGERELGAYRFGLVPSFARDPSVGARCFNARAESAAERPAFRAAFAGRHLAVVADGFYEWRRDREGGRQPFYFSRADGSPLAFAGLFEVWRDRALGEGAPALRSCAILTAAAGPDLAPVHDRMPVVLEPEELQAWLELRGGGGAEELLRPARAGTLVSWPVGRRVGNVRNDDPGLLDPVGDPLAAMPRG